MTIEQVKQECRELLNDDIASMVAMCNGGSMKHLQAGYILEGKYNDEEAVKVWAEVNS